MEIRIIKPEEMKNNKNVDTDENLIHQIPIVYEDGVICDENIVGIVDDNKSIINPNVDLENAGQDDKENILDNVAIRMPTTVAGEHKKMVIEVAMPLSRINDFAGTEKLIMHRNISTMHQYFSLKPIAWTKPVIAGSLITDPGSYLPENEAIIERRKIHNLLVELAISGHQGVGEINEYINRSTGNNPPAVYDPFSGRGSIPFAAQIIGLDSYGSDLNPIAVTITKALIELPGKYKDQAPKCPVKSSPFKTFKNAEGLADDIRYYGGWIEREAFRRIGHLYPKVNMNGREYTIIVQLYIREVICPNPACLSNVPLANQFWLSTKNKVWLEPNIDKSTRPNSVSFKIKTGGEPQKGTVSRSGARCICCNAPVSFDHIREQGKLGKINERVVAIVVEGDRKKIYISPDGISIPNAPDSNFLNDIKTNAAFNPLLYGYDTIGKLFNQRQRYTLETFVKLVSEARSRCIEDCKDEDYANAITVYLTLAAGRLANRMSRVCMWHKSGEVIVPPFSEQGVPMTWDYVEVNPFSNSTGNWRDSLEWIPECIESVPAGKGKAFQSDAAKPFELKSILISTDPPYYDSILYADLSDYFYGIFRTCLKNIYPDMFSTIGTPKDAEIVAASHRYGNKKKAGEHFFKRLSMALQNVANSYDNRYPITIYYAFAEKKYEQKDYYTAWESVIAAIINSGLQIVRTWPVHTERVTALRAEKCSLASSVLLVCRKRTNNTIISRRDFMYYLKKELPSGIKILQDSFISPVDIAQSATGLGMEIFSRYSKVSEADGRQMNVKVAMETINKELDIFLMEQESGMDPETRFCVYWYERFSWNLVMYDEADKIARAKGANIKDLESLYLISRTGGKVRLLKREELEKNWNPINDKKLVIWKILQHSINILDQKGEKGVIDMLKTIKHDTVNNCLDSVKELAYRLYSVCDEKKWEEDKFAYNRLTSSWQHITNKVSIQTQRTSAGW